MTNDITTNVWAKINPPRHICLKLKPHILDINEVLYWLWVKRVLIFTSNLTWGRGSKTKNWKLEGVAQLHTSKGSNQIL